MTDHSSLIQRQEWLTNPVDDDVRRSLDRLAAARDVRYLAVMPDVHLTSDVCVGVTMATESTLYPSAVGGDIGCGMAAIRIDANARRLAKETNAGKLMASLYRLVPSLKHRGNTIPAGLSDELQQLPLSSPRLEKMKSREARVQLGTLGRGNHFLEFQADQDDQLWLMLHSGSRGMGQAISAHHMAAARGQPKSQGLITIDANSPAGEAYLNDVAWAVQYARANRRSMIAAVETIMDELFSTTLDWPSLVDCDHNHVRRESHFGTPLWVHRKGSLPADDNAPGVIPGSMGTSSFHVTGRGCKTALRSSSHGAGRRMSRGVASRAISSRRFETEMKGIWYDHRLIAHLREEAPSAYRDIHEVMRAQRKLTRIERELRPLLSYKGT